MIAAHELPFICRSLILLATCLATSLAGKCFKNGDELRAAVSDYLTHDDFARETYGEEIGQWCVSKVQDFSYVFSDVFSAEPLRAPHARFNEPLDGWDTSNALYMSGMFHLTQEFNQKVDHFNVQRVLYFDEMFSQAEKFNQPLDSWNTTSAYDMSLMFATTPKFQQPVGHFNVENVASLKGMFEYSVYNLPLDNWDTSSARNMQSMFSNSKVNASTAPFLSDFLGLTFGSIHLRKFNQDISHFNVKRVRDFSFMFLANAEFNRDISEWNMRNGESTWAMFWGASGFKQNLCPWGDHLWKGTEVSEMFGTDPDESQAGASSCPEYDEPDLRNEDPPGPFCFHCGGGQERMHVVESCLELLVDKCTCKTSRSKKTCRQRRSRPAKWKCSGRSKCVCRRVRPRQCAEDLIERGCGVMSSREETDTFDEFEEILEEKCG